MLMYNLYLRERPSTTIAIALYPGDYMRGKKHAKSSTLGPLRSQALSKSKEKGAMSALKAKVR